MIFDRADPITGDSTERGIRSIFVDSIAEFTRLIEEDYASGHVFRGQQSIAWPLRSSFDRVISHPEWPDRTARDLHEELLMEHFGNFERSIKRMSLVEERDRYHGLAALGQHYGLTTNFLDWTTSAHYALFFAFEGRTLNDDHRVVWVAKATDGTQWLGTTTQTIGGETRFISYVRFLKPEHATNLRQAS